MNIDREDFRMSALSTEYFYNRQNVTVELVACLTAPLVFDDLIGPVIKRVKQTAKCHPDDPYSLEKGKKIALAKAESKAYSLLAKELEKKYNYLLDFIETMKPLKDDFLEKTEKCVKHNEGYIADISRVD